MKRKHRLIIYFLLNLFFIRDMYADYPELTSLSNSDILYKQLQDDISAYYRSLYSGKEKGRPPLTFFTYSIETKDDLFSVSAKVNIPYETLATLNRIGNTSFFRDVGMIIIPNTPGIFVPDDPESDLEQIMHSFRLQGGAGSGNGVIVMAKIREKMQKFYFFPGSRFHPVERAYFLQILFRFPVRTGKVTSAFGNRKNPFSGHPEVHNGIDIGAKAGSDVYAARDGKIIETGYSEIYGNYILISHPGGYQSFYGHLKEICVTLLQEVYSGMIIGKVGTTGRSTGPHLHFEIRRNGKAQDPATFFD